jgi:hypothetical protein
MEGNPKANEVNAAAFADDLINFLLEILESFFVSINENFFMQLLFNGGVY